MQHVKRLPLIVRLAVFMLLPTLVCTVGAAGAAARIGSCSPKSSNASGTASSAASCMGQGSTQWSLQLQSQGYYCYKCKSRYPELLKQLPSIGSVAPAASAALSLLFTLWTALFACWSFAVSQLPCNRSAGDNTHFWFILPLLLPLPLLLGM